MANVLNRPIIIAGGGGGIKALFDAKKSCYYEFYRNSSLVGDALNSILSYSDTENVTNMSYMFYDCLFLTKIPPLDTSKVTDMSYMFSKCSKITTIPTLDTSKVSNMTSMFSNCTSLTTIPTLDTSNVSNMGSMFYGDKALTTIPALDTSNVSNMSSTFKNCTSLKSILMTGMKVSFDISSSTQFERSDLVTILNNLATVSGKTLTMGSTNLAKLTDEDKAIATNKGWTLA